MKILVAALIEGQILPVEHTYDPKTLDLEFIDYHFTEPVRMEGTVEKIADVVTLRGRLSSRLEQTCGRCLDVKASPVAKDFNLFYDIQNREEIETIDDLREILIMDHPLTYLCRANCKGLCPQCGTNRNRTDCKCSLTKTPESLSSWQLAWKKKSGGKSHG